MTKLHEHGAYSRSTFDVLIGGTPCQSFSMAGLRGGLDDDRGNLALEFIRILARKRPRFFIWENVPGVFSSNAGCDFASILAGFTGRAVECPADGWKNAGIIEGIPEAYGIAWRVLDAQHFGVAQRRRRVFVVGCLGDWRCASAVLFEPESLQRHNPKGRKAREEVATGIDGSADGGSEWPPKVAPTVLASYHKNQGASQQDIHCQSGGLLTKTYRWQNSTDGIVEDDISATVKASATSINERSTPAYVMDTGQANAEILAGQSPALTCNHEQPILFNAAQGVTNRGLPSKESCYTLDTTSKPAVCIDWSEELTPSNNIASTIMRGAQGGRRDGVYEQRGIRRLTPDEFARLQGFPDGYCRIPKGRYAPDKPSRSRPNPDGPQYKAYGNSMAVPVIRWLGERIESVIKILQNK